MLLLRMAARNVFRHRTRSLVTLSTIVFGCSALMLAGGFFEDLYRQIRENSIKAHTGHLQIQKKGFSTIGQSDPFEYMLPASPSLMSELRAIPSIRQIVPEINTAGLISTGDNTVSCFVAAKDASEGSVSLLRGKALGPQDSAVLVGRGLADAIGVDVGSTVTLLVKTKDESVNGRDMVVAGICTFGTKEMDDNMILAPLGPVQGLLRTDEVQQLTIFLDDTRNTQPAKKSIEALFREHPELEIRTWMELSEFYAKTRVLFGQWFSVLKFVITLIVVLSVYNSASMAVVERTAEVGTSRAMGAKQRHVVASFLLEGLVLGLVGGVIGVGLGALVTALSAAVGFRLASPPGFTFDWISRPMISPSAGLFALGMSVLTSVVASYFPASRVSRMDVSHALRTTH